MPKIKSNWIYFKKLIGKHSNNDANEIFKGSFASFLNRFLGLVIGYFFSLIVTRELGAETWGVFSLCLAVVTLLGIISRLGYDSALLRFNAELRKNRNYKLLTDFNYISLLISFAVGIALSIAFYYSSNFIATTIFNKQNLAEYFKIASFSLVPLSISYINSRALKGFKKIIKGTYIEYIPLYLYFLIAISYLIYFGYSITISQFLWIFVVVSYIRVVQGCYWHIKEIGRFSDVNINRIKIKRISKVALPLLLASSMLYFKGWLDTLMIGVFMSETDVGIYNIVLKLANIVSLPIVAINTIAAPKFAESYKNKGKLQEIVSVSTKMIFLFTLPILVITIMFSEEILYIFGNEFIVANNVLIIIAIGSFINAISGSVGYLLQMTGSHVAYQNITVIGSVITLVLNLIFIPVFGLMGAAITSLTVQIIWNGSMVIYIHKKYGIRTYYVPFLSETLMKKSDAY